MIESTNVRGPSQSIVESTNDAAQSPLVGSAAINQKSNQKGEDYYNWQENDF